MSKRKRKVFLISGIAVLAALFALLWVVWEKQKEELPQQAAVSDGDDNTIIYNGKKYKYNADIKTVLFLGVDKSGTASVESVEGRGGQADTILLYVMDREKKTARFVEIPRDSMAQVALYDVSGRHISDEKTQIALQYAYGSSPKQSSILMTEAVEQLFYGIDVNDYFTLYVEGINQIVDALGGVTLTVPEDYTVIDPSFVKGDTVTLNGEKAQKYVRYRDTEVTGSNLERMERQQQFIRALFSQFGEQDVETGRLYQILDAAQDYLVMGMTADKLKELTEYTVEEEVLRIPGEMKAGSEHDEFHVSEDKLHEFVLDMFFIPVAK